ncbi:phosphoribosyltransferase [Microbacterium sp. P5_E9]
MAIFVDRADAGRQLAAALEAWRGQDAVVLGIPRGGVVVAAEVARAMKLPLGVAVVRKLGAPTQEEYAIGAIAEGVRVVNPDAIRGVTPEELAVVEDLERIELRRRTRLFAPVSIELTARVAVIVDDGVATGATATAACRAIRAAAPAQIVLAVPVAPAHWRPEAAAADAFVCPHPMRDFWAVGQFYEDFTQTTDEEVARLLRHASTGSATEDP